MLPCLHKMYHGFDLYFLRTNDIEYYLLCLLTNSVYSWKCFTCFKIKAINYLPCTQVFEIYDV